jgi:hypothetical protein
VTYGPVSDPVNLVPFSFDLSSHVPRSVATLYSNIVTRPTGRAVRLGIESHIGELGSCCLSVLDFTQVVVLDYSCADEAVAKLVQRYLDGDRPADVYFVARGLAEQHRDPIEAVLARHRLALVAELAPHGFVLLGDVGEVERSVWSALQQRGYGEAIGLAAAFGCGEAEMQELLESLARRRVVLRCQAPPNYYTLSALISRA